MTPPNRSRVAPPSTVATHSKTSTDPSLWKVCTFYVIQSNVNLIVSNRDVIGFVELSDNTPAQSRVRVMHVKHAEGPLDGSLYAQVTKHTSHQQQQQQHQHRHVTSSSSHRTQQQQVPVQVQVSSRHHLDYSADSGISSPLSGKIIPPPPVIFPLFKQNT